MERIRRCTWVVVALAMGGYAASAQALVFTVGAGPACTHGSIQAALNEGVAVGESIDDLAGRIRTLFAQTYANRAETVRLPASLAGDDEAYLAVVAVDARRLPGRRIDSGELTLIVDPRSGFAEHV